MRIPSSAFDLHAPRTLDEALRTLGQEPGAWRPFAGGTDLMVLMEAGKLPPGRYLSLQQLRELRYVNVADDGVTIGALTTYTDLLRHDVLNAEYRLLVQAARETGGVATQNRGTIGGNIANASPAADTPPALLVYDAELELRSINGTRRVPYDRFHTGYKKMDLAAVEIITAIRLPRRRAGWIETYRKVGTRRAQAIAKVCFAAAVDLNGDVIRDVRIAFGSVAPVVLRAGRVEQWLRGKQVSRELAQASRDELQHDIAPIDDVRSTAEYRGRVAGNLLVDFLGSLSR